MVLVSAHRGGAGDVRDAQNTLAAFEAAIDLGCDYVELDVRFASDGTAVVSHEALPPDDDGIARLALDDVLALIRGRVNAHVDLKVRGR